MKIEIIVFGKPSDKDITNFEEVIGMGANQAGIARPSYEVKEGRFGIWFFQMNVIPADYSFWKGFSMGMLFSAMSPHLLGS